MGVFYIVELKLNDDGEYDLYDPQKTGMMQKTSSLKALKAAWEGTILRYARSPTLWQKHKVEIGELCEGCRIPFRSYTPKNGEKYEYQ